MNKFCKKFLIPVCEVLLGFAGLGGIALLVVFLMLTFPIWVIPYIILRPKITEDAQE